MTHVLDTVESALSDASNALHAIPVDTDAQQDDVTAVDRAIDQAMDLVLFIIRRESRSRQSAGHVLVAQAGLLLVFMAMGTLNAPLRDHDSPVVIAIGLVAAAAMAVQNTAARTFLSHLPPTTVMTGNLMQVIVDAIDVLYGHGDRSVQRTRLARLLPMLAGFVAGTLAGAAGYLTVGFPCLIVPAILVAGLGFHATSNHPAHG